MKEWSNQTRLFYLYRDGEFKDCPQPECLVKTTDLMYQTRKFLILVYVLSDTHRVS